MVEQVQVQRRPAWKRIIPAASLAALFIFCVAIGFLAVRAKSHHRTFQQEVVNIFIPTPEQMFGKDRIQMLVLGIDYNYTEKDIPFSSGARSDTIFAVTLDFPTRSVSEV
ncbi:MAG: hypothetical protein ACREMT_04355, partial [Vulcanimicrobiaceae bacterium]